MSAWRKLSVENGDFFLSFACCPGGGKKKAKKKKIAHLLKIFSDT